MKRILLVLRTGAELFPPTLNQIAILSENGFHVSLVDGGPQPLDTSRHSLPPGVEHTRIPSASRTAPFIRRILAVCHYVRTVRRMLRRISPDLVIAYDAEACWAVGRTTKSLRVPLVWHFHELPEPQEEGVTVHIANRWVLANASLPDLIVFPDRGRADYFRSKAKGDTADIRIAANCPRPLGAIPTSHAATDFRESLPHGAFVLLYHGAIGKDHGFETAIASIPKWPSNAVFVLKGHGSRDYAKHLRTLARRHHVEDRLFMPDFGFQSYADHCSVIASADAGWTVLEPTCNNWKYSATASNKRFECMALGLPQISDRNPGVPELVENNGCGICVDYHNQDSIAAAVNGLRESNHLREGMAERGRAAHRATFNYDSQFAPVLERIEEWTQA